MDQSTPNKLKIGILGGSFDPVHLGHLHLANETLKAFSLDQILWVPAYISPYKLDQEPTAASHRLNMLQQAIAGKPKFKISDMEILRQGVSYSTDTVKKLTEENPNSNFNLIMGCDTFKEIYNWRNCEELFTLCNLIISNRPGFPYKESKKALDKINLKYQLIQSDSLKKIFKCSSSHKTISFFEINPLDISSSQIRKAIQNGDSLKKMLPPKVERYIMEYRLYQKESLPEN